MYPAFQRALPHRVIPVIGQPQRLVGGHEHAMRAGKNPLPEGSQEIAVAVEHHHRMFATVEDVDIVFAVDADTADFLERPAGGQFRPVHHRFVHVLPVAHGRHGCFSPLLTPASLSRTPRTGQSLVRDDGRPTAQCR
jgi:hypothetical protein